VQWAEVEEGIVEEQPSQEDSDSTNAIKALLEMQSGRVIKMQTSEGQRCAIKSIPHRVSFYRNFVLFS
jgi:hypothetical protein